MNTRLPIRANRTQLPVGISFSGVVHTCQDNFSIDRRFAMVREAGSFDYIEKSPTHGEVDQYLEASERHGIPVRATSSQFMLRRDEELLLWQLKIAHLFGATVHNIMMYRCDGAGRALSDSDVAEAYVWMLEAADRFGITPCLENHVDMWSESTERVARVAHILKSRGIDLALTLDPSHVVFKAGNDTEFQREERVGIASNRNVPLDPRAEKSICAEWINNNLVCHAHARAAAINNPRNIWAKNPDGTYGRGIQYPFIEPKPGEWHSDWDEKDLTPWMAAMKKLLDYHVSNDSSRLTSITAEFIPAVDYGAGSRYSIFENNISVANWLRAKNHEALESTSELA